MKVENPPFWAFNSSSHEDTFALGKCFGTTLKPNAIVALSGDLGTGKTTFIKGLITAVASLEPFEINSPTFTYLNIYSHKKVFYHFDLYRLRNAEEFLSLGFDEYFCAGGICCIEWAERISPILPNETLLINISYAENINERNIQITSVNA